MTADFKTGDVGENLVQLWASQAGITANPVRRDEFGWDFCLQVRHGSSSTTSAAPLDQLPPELTCMVQVKATAVGAKSEDVSLSNWQRMVKDPFPWFFARVILDSEGEAERVYLVHVDERWMERVLRRLRGASSRDAKPIHQQTLSLTWTDEEALAQPFRTSLRERLLTTVGDVTGYVQQKAKNFRDLGYGRSRFEATVTTPLHEQRREDIELGVDFAIGLVKSLPVSALTVRDLRFDIPHVVADHPKLDGGTMEFSVVPSVGITRLTFSNEQRTKSVTLACATYIPTLLFPRLPKEFFKVRFVSPLATIVSDLSTMGMKIRWQLPEGDAPVPLSDIASGAALLVLFADSSDGGVRVAYEKNGEVNEFARSNSSPEISSTVRRLAAVAQDAVFLAKYFDLSAEMPVGADRLLDGASQLAAMRGVLDRTTGKLAIGVRIESDANADGKRAAIVLPMSARVEDSILAATIVYAGTARWNDGDKRLTIEDGHAQIMGKWVVPIDEWAAFRHTDKARQLAADLSSGTDYDFVTGPGDID